MNKAIQALLLTMFNKKIIGNKHTPEKKIILSKIKWLSKEERKEFNKEYNKLVNDQLILRCKKRTKKDFDFHISFNPRKLKEVLEYGSIC